MNPYSDISSRFISANVGDHLPRSGGTPPAGSEATKQAKCRSVGVRCIAWLGLYPFRFEGGPPWLYILFGFLMGAYPVSLIQIAKLVAQVNQLSR